jgi:glycosyltransferase involved in cell wall biosynthesis
MQVTQVSIGRFHHFHLARQLEKFGLLKVIYTGYPRFKLSDEIGIPPGKIITFPWLQGPYMARHRVGLHRSAWLDREWAWWATETLDRFVSRDLRDSSILIALSGSGLHSGRRMQQLGGIHICDRGSTHIRSQEEILMEEYQRYGKTWQGIDPRLIDKEEAEYDQADVISIPSQFCYDSFISKGLPASKLIKIPYGSRIERFHPVHVEVDANEFRILFVGAACPRKGFIDLLEAFNLFDHPNKKLVLIGSLSPEARDLLDKTDTAKIEVKGTVPNSQLALHYSQATVFVLPSIEEGLALVMGEAMACGCPVIATKNTGAGDLIDNEINGFIVPVRSPEKIVIRLQQLANNRDFLKQMKEAALLKAKSLLGWDSYGLSWQNYLTMLYAP